MHAEEDTPEDMGVDTRVAMVVTLVATEADHGGTPATSTTDHKRQDGDGYFMNQRRCPSTDKNFDAIAPNSARSSGRRFQPKSPGTGLSPGLSKHHAKLAREVTIPHRNEHRRYTHLVIL